MDLNTALQHADEGTNSGLLGAYPMSSRVLAEEVRHLRARIYLAVMDERNACIGICSKYRGMDGESIADEISARLPPNVEVTGTL